METPGECIVEKSAFPNSVVEAATAIPAFIGITEKAQNGPEQAVEDHIHDGVPAVFRRGSCT